MIDMRDFSSMFLVTLFACACLPAAAFTPNVPEHGLPSAADYSTTLLPELQGVVSWKTLAQVEPVKRDGKIIPSFSSQILALDSQLVRINGFMMPLDMTEQQKHFLISAVPSSCPFCMPAGPEEIVAVGTLISDDRRRVGQYISQVADTTDRRDRVVHPLAMSRYSGTPTGWPPDQGHDYALWLESTSRGLHHGYVTAHPRNEHGGRHSRFAVRLDLPGEYSSRAKAEVDAFHIA